MTEWEAECLLCAARGRRTRLETGHCCLPCAAHLATTVADIARLAADAAASLTPRPGTGTGSIAYGSKPPISVDAVDPELTLTGPPPSPTVLEVLELWERMIREMRGMAPYGPASAARARAGLYAGTSATLVGCVGFLGRSLPWATTKPDFPLEDFADEIRSCVRVLRRWDVTAEDRGTMVKCPTVHEDEGECGYRLYYRDMDELVTCRRCGATRSAETLLAITVTDDREVWVDLEAASRYSGVDQRTLKLWAKRGHLTVRRGMYDLTSIQSITEGATA